MMNLSVNLNKVALLRNSRGADNPAPLQAARVCLDTGAAGLTLHLREDRRHTREGDVRDFSALCRERGAEFNLEGDPRPELLELALEIRPTQLTLVPVTPGEVTSDHGWDLPREQERIAPIIRQAKRSGMRVAIFMDPDPALMRGAADTGADRVELYTEPYAASFGTERQGIEHDRLCECIRVATELGLGVNAGHDLNLQNLPLLARTAPELLEVSIGHALLADALYLGLAEAVGRYLQAARGEDVDAPVTR